MHTHILGFPRIGENRELKKALEEYWNGAIPLEELRRTGETIKRRNWRIQRDSGLSLITTGDFSFYDHVLDTSMLLGVVPEPYAGEASSAARYFQMARGDGARGIPPLPMTKWFNTNYHYLTPEFTPGMALRPCLDAVTHDVEAAAALGCTPKPVLLGPVTYLWLSRERSCDRWKRLPEILSSYATALSRLAPLCPWIQMDEPVLCVSLPSAVRRTFTAVYKELHYATRARLLLTTYFGELGENLDLALNVGCAALHIDLAQSAEQLDAVLEKLPEEMTLSLGVVSGRSVWKTDFAAALHLLRRAASRIGMDRLMAASSCSLLHVPLDLEREERLDPIVKGGMAFAVQKCAEIAVLGDVLQGKDRMEALERNQAALAAFAGDPHRRDDAVRRRCATVTPEMLVRRSPLATRRALQQEKLHLPLFPTTTIGSFPQTEGIRRARREFRQERLSAADYDAFLKREIEIVIARQEALGLDVLVHGEAERVDMVEYFGQRLKGFCFTEHGWVQSYGSRCVKPPIIVGDISRPQPITVETARYAQSLTKKPVKGMITGPVTILCWSFVREDLPPAEVCRQIALALRDETLDLEQAGLPIIQIDEAALREGLPLKQEEAEDYLRWAVDAFRLTASGVSDVTQIHTHMCYSEFNAILPWIAAMDADVISIEASRGKMALLDAFAAFRYPGAVGPGVYDIHSPRVPDVEEILGLLRQALRCLMPQQLWVNPDCGLKTRRWPETLASLKNMVAATKRLREE